MKVCFIALIVLASIFVSGDVVVLFLVTKASSIADDDVERTIANEMKNEEIKEKK